MHYPGAGRDGHSSVPPSRCITYSKSRAAGPAYIGLDRGPSGGQSVEPTDCGDNTWEAGVGPTATQKTPSGGARGGVTVREYGPK